MITRRGQLVPTPQEIRLIDDPVELQELLDELTVDASRLETRLEFPEDDDPERERGLRNRLAFCRSAIKAIDKQQKRLTSGSAAADAVTIAKSKETRAVAAAEQTSAAAKIVQLKTEKARDNLRVQEANIKAKLLKSVSWHVCFVRAARNVLPSDLRAKIEEAADADYMERMHQEVEPHIRSER
jgi:hypothetical protein